ncbi:MAG: FecR family protein, partial [Deltaproteobacteria bacterium]|nr:FecR family protein [Deltaproteobacteria bacterium]
ITFSDNSTLTISPESRVGIEAYMFDSSQNKRNAVVQLFQGLAHVVVSKIFKSAEPDFVVKTQTAIMGVRGTEFGIRLQPNSSEILNFEGVLQVGNIFPEVSQLFRKAFKAAYSFGPEGGGAHHWVFLQAMQGTTVGQGLPPIPFFTLTPEDRKVFMRQLVIDFISHKGGGDTGSGEGGAITPTGAHTGDGGSTGQQGSYNSNVNQGLALASFFQTAFSNFTVYTPPPDRQPLEKPVLNTTNPDITPTTPTPTTPPTPSTPSTPSTYNFTLSIYGEFLQSAAASPVSITSAGSAVLQGNWGDALPSLYKATDSSIFAPTSGTFSNRQLGVYTTELVGTVSGVLGSTLTGSATLSSSYSSFRY